jgi:hypothetical protein
MGIFAGFTLGHAADLLKPSATTCMAVTQAWNKRMHPKQVIDSCSWEDGGAFALLA